jgi:RecA/RadA recombinase
MAKEKESILTAEEQIASYLKNNKEDHYNFEEEVMYPPISSGSLSLDIEMGGGIRPGIIRACGVTEGGKTSCMLSFARNFQLQVENSMVIYIKAEGRLSDEMIKRSGVNTDPDKWFLFKTNIYETAISLLRELVKNNPSGKKYFFIIDSMDALIPKGDANKSFEESIKVAGGALLTSSFLKNMALAMSNRGHICVLISQVRSQVEINPYAKGDPKITNASGGNAALHFSDWILEFQERWKKDLIFADGEKGEIIGHWCKIVFRKSPNEKTGKDVRYPIRYGRQNGKSVWVEREICDQLIKWEYVTAKGAWITISDELEKEIKENGLVSEFKKQIQGMERLYDFVEQNPKLVEYLYKKFKKTLAKCNETA